MKTAVLGSGSWGTALAVMLDKYGHDVTVWSWQEEEARRIREDGEHKEFLPGVPIRKEIKIVTSPEEAVKDAEIIIAAVAVVVVHARQRAFAGAARKALRRKLLAHIALVHHIVDICLLLGVIGLLVYARNACIIVLFQLPQCGIIVAVQAVFHRIVGIIQGCHAAVICSLRGGAALGLQCGCRCLLLGVDAL